MSLGEAIPIEQARVRALILEYHSLEGGVGLIASSLMEQTLQVMDNALMKGDLVAMLRLYEELRAYE